MNIRKKYPFKFLDAYSREDKDIFFGRQEEIDRLYEMTFQSDLILVYGASGTGKSSLIQCGLAGKFESHDWLPLFIRRGNDINASFETVLKDTIGEEQPSEINNDLAWLDEQGWTGSGNTQVATRSLSPMAKDLKAIYLRYFKPVYLIFDQFEELYVLGDKKEQEQFIQTIKDILRVEHPVKIILSIREEYLGYLYEFERKVPELLRKKIRVEPMNLEKVKIVLMGINDLPFSNVHLKKGEEEAIAEGIFDKIKGDEKTLSIQLPYLQVFLDKLYLDITKDQSRHAEAEFSLNALKEIGDLGDILRNFLDDQVFTTANDLKQSPEIIWSVLSPFVSLEGTKEPIGETELFDRLPHLNNDLISNVLQAFVKSRLLRFTEKEQLFEIAHDSLAKHIHDKRSKDEIAIMEVRRLIKSQTIVGEFYTEKSLLFIEPYEDKIKLTQEEKQWIEQSKQYLVKQKAAEEAQKAAKLKAAKRRFRTVSGLLVLAVIALGAAGIFWYKASNSEEAANNALKDFKAAQAKKELLEFNILKSRAETILKVDGCPVDILNDMKSIAKNYPDSVGLAKTIQSLLNRNKDCPW